MQLGEGGRKGAIREMLAGVAQCKRVLPVADCLPTKAFAETVVIRAHGFLELHFIRAWHAQAAQAFAGPFRSSHPPTEIATRVEWDGRMDGTMCAPWRSVTRRSPHERPAPQAVRKIKIPDVCIGLGVKCMSHFEMLRRGRARFVLEE